MSASRAKHLRRISLAEAQNWRCAYCTGDMSIDSAGPDLATIEHLWGRKRNKRAYCVSACRACNEARGDMHCIWRFGALRRRLLELGVWPACQDPPRTVLTLLKAAVETPFPIALASALTPTPRAFTEDCIGLCHDR